MKAILGPKWFTQTDLKLEQVERKNNAKFREQLKCILTAPSALDTPPKGGDQKGCTLTWQSESTKHITKAINSTI